MAVSTLEELTRYRWSSDDDADKFSVENPATGNVITVVQGAGAAQMNAAIESAHQAFVRDWRWRDRTERARLLLSCAEVLEAHADELADLLSLENGKPVADARDNDVRFLIGVFRFFGSIVDKLPSGDFHDTGSIYSATVLEPFGVVGAIIPFNWPPIHTGGKIAPALAVGNTVVKPSEAALLTVIRIAELCNQVLPADVLHVVPGRGSVVGQALAANPNVSRLAATVLNTRDLLPRTNRKPMARHGGNRIPDFGSLGSGLGCPNQCRILFGEPQARYVVNHAGRNDRRGR
jgi:acyl-CoA reductase-like NAD-dependent aldehyde dehydrogenase